MLLSAKQIEKNRPIADNRKALFLKSVLDPLNSPEVSFNFIKNLLLHILDENSKKNRQIFEY